MYIGLETPLNLFMQDFSLDSILFIGTKDFPQTLLLFNARRLLVFV